MACMAWHKIHNVLTNSPKSQVLVLLPFRSHALAFVKAALEMMPEAVEQVRII